MIIAIGNTYFDTKIIPEGGCYTYAMADGIINITKSNGYIQIAKLDEFGKSTTTLFYCPDNAMYDSVVLPPVSTPYQNLTFAYKSEKAIIKDDVNTIYPSTIPPKPQEDRFDVKMIEKKPKVLIQEGRPMNGLWK
jgi:hypothetical protein